MRRVFIGRVFRTRSDGRRWKYWALGNKKREGRDTQLNISSLFPSARAPPIVFAGGLSGSADGERADPQRVLQFCRECSFHQYQFRATEMESAKISTLLLSWPPHIERIWGAFELNEIPSNKDFLWTLSKILFLQCLVLPFTTKI
jgi:hypothetical protein